MAKNNNEEEIRRIEVNSNFYTDGFPKEEEDKKRMDAIANMAESWGVGGVLFSLLTFCGIVVNILKDFRPNDLVLIENYSQLSKALEGFVNEQTKKWEEVKKKTGTN